MKRYISIILVLCLFASAVLPAAIFGDAHLISFSKTNEEELLDSEDVHTNETEDDYKHEDTEEDSSEPTDTDNDIQQPEDTEDGTPELEDTEEDALEPEDTDKIDPEYDKDEEDPPESEYPEDVDTKPEDTEKVEPEYEKDIPEVLESENVDDVDTEPEDTEEEPKDDPNDDADIDDNEDDDLTYILIFVDDDRNIIILTSPEIAYEITEENTEFNYEGKIIISLKPHSSEVEIRKEDIHISLPAGWTYEINFNSYVVTVTLFEELIPIYVEEDTTVWHSISGHIVIYEAVCSDDDHGGNDPPRPLANVLVSLLHGEQLVDTTFTDESGRYYFLAMSFDTETLDEWSVVAEVEGFETESAWLSDHAPDDSSAPVNIRSTDISHIYIDFQLEIDMAMLAAFSSSFTPIEIPDTADFFEVTNETQLRAALASTSAVVAVRIMNDIEISTAAAMPITNGGTGRIVHIYSNTDGAFSIIRTAGTGRHININGSRQLHLWNVTLTRPGPSNPAGNGGGINVDAAARLHMHAGSTISNNRNTATLPAFQGGGGVRLAGTAHATINDGAMICDNIATINGGGIYVASGTGTLTMNGGTIENNRQNSTSSGDGGGGVFIHSGASFTMRGGYIQNNFSSNTAGGVQVAGSGGSGRALFNMSGGQILYNDAAGAGGGIHMNTNSEFNMSGDAVIHGNEAAGSGGGIRVYRGTGTGAGTINVVTISDNARISGNRAGTTGGGLSTGGGGGQNHNITINSGTITGNTAVNDGGGIFIQNPLATGSWLRIFDGSITNNTANNGGGIFIPHVSLGSVTIAYPVVFVGNVARNGMMIDNNLHQTHYPRIGPDTVSVAWIEETSPGSGIFREATPHAFTNYDINVTGLRFWRVTYETEDEDAYVSAHVGSNQFVVSNGTFVPSGSEVTFTAEPAPRFDWWDIGIRDREIAENGSDIDFVFSYGGIDTPLLRSITSHTHVVAHFKEDILTTLSISKTVTGTFSNLNMPFNFTILFKYSDGSPLPFETQFHYTGDIITNSGATAPQNGTLTLDSNGSATFTLGHGQLIVIEDIPMSIQVQVIELPDMYYTASFIDSENENVVINENDTTLLPMAENRVFSFTNARIYIPPTGINLGSNSVILLLVGLIFSSVLIMYATGKVFRSKRL